jgi:hypothetical protein
LQTSDPESESDTEIEQLPCVADLEKKKHKHVCQYIGGGGQSKGVGERRKGSKKGDRIQGVE